MIGKKFFADFHNNKVFVANTGRKGLGMFAKKKIKKGEIIEVSPTVEIPCEDQELLDNSILSHYMFNYEGKDCSVLGLGTSSLYNHSESPNVDYYMGDRRIVMRAIKNIKKNEELTIDYGWADSHKEELV